jgi:peptidoglycan hydrolase-like protein with peptidoglycan-binding domain
MTDPVDTHNVDATAGAVYFIVGRGTEGGGDSFHLSVAGVSRAEWGTVGAVAANSGYSIGTIQVDLGQQGLRAVGAATDRALKPGEKTYVDAIIEHSSAYAQAHGLIYTDDKVALRTDLLSHGDGRGKHASIHFIDTHTRDSINQWTSSNEGKQWIHQNVDYPQIKNITRDAIALVDRYGTNISEDRRLETISILAKTENQIPAKMAGFETILKNGGNYEDVRKHADALHDAIRFYDGTKAADIAATYQANYATPGQKEALDRANEKVSSATYNPSNEKTDADVQAALKAIGQGARTHAHHQDSVLRTGHAGAAVNALQTDLATLGYTDAKGQWLKTDGHFGAATQAALEAFQRDHHLAADGIAGPKTMAALHQIAQANKTPGLDHAANADHALYLQAQKAVHDLDARLGRAADQSSENAAAALTVAARREGLIRIDQVTLSEDGSRAFAVQNDTFPKFAHVQTAQAVHTTVEQSSQAMEALHKASPPAHAQPPASQHTAPAMGM